jgi:hypothetical protein
MMAICQRTFIAGSQGIRMKKQIMRSPIHQIILAAVVLLVPAAFIHFMPLSAVTADEPAGTRVSKKYPTKLVESLPFGDEFFEVTEAGTLRRRYRVWGSYAKELAAWKAKVGQSGAVPSRTFRLGCIFLKDAEVVFPEVPGTDGKPLRGKYTTPPAFMEAMRARTAQEYSDFSYAFTGGAVKCEWTFETLTGVKWTGPGKNSQWSCQARAVAEQIEPMLAKYKDAKIDMWVFCAGKPETLNGKPKQNIGSPPYGVSYTQWQLYGGFSIVICAPHLGLVVHEVNHRYLDNLKTIEGVQLTLFHGLSAMGYEFGDLGFDEADLATYRSVYLHIIRPAMWRRFSLTGPNGAKSEPFSGKLYAWKDVSDDCWFRLPLLGQDELAKLTGLPSLKFAAPARTMWRHFTVSEADRPKILSPYTDSSGENDTALNNLLSLYTESAAVLRTATGHWLIVRPEEVEVYVQMLAGRGKGAPLEVAGWINEGVCPLLVLRAPTELAVPKREIDYFR